MMSKQEKPTPVGLSDLAPDLIPLELQILELTWRGYSLSMIGAALRLSTRTVEMYRYAMLKKFGVTNAMSMVHTALKQGLLKV
jgi:DNA-binding NarL/FixJ family response regulator